MTVTLSQGKHREYRDVFYRTLTKSPKNVTLVKLTPTVSKTDLKEFVGATTPKEDSHVLPCLYQEDVADFDEGLTGYQNLEDTLLYLSPLQLKPIFGTYKPDGKNMKFILDGREFIVLRVVPLEELFDDCIAVEFHLKDKLRG